MMSLPVPARGRRQERRHGGNQSARIGMPRSVQKIDRRTLFHHAALLHHRHPVGDLGDDAEIVGNEKNRGSLTLLQIRG